MLIKSKLYEFDNQISRILAVGDLHGDFSSYEKIINRWKKEEGAFLIFLGDYADRGNRGVEILDSLMDLASNERIIILKGNHEDYPDSGEPYFSPCNLVSEVERKKGNWIYYFRHYLGPFFKSLFLAARLPGKILFIHGGISRRINGLEDLKNPSRDVELDVIWSDPIEKSGEYPNERGSGVEFGPDVTAAVLQNLGVRMVIRSHQPQKASLNPLYSQDGKILTISSTQVFSGTPYYLEIINTADNFTYQVKYI